MRIKAVVLCWLLVTSFSAFSAQQQFIVGTEDINFYPHYDFTRPDSPGFANEVLALFSKEYGYRFSFQPLPVKRLYHELDNLVDFIYPDNPHWAKFQGSQASRVFSEPVIYNLGTTLVLPANKDIIHATEQLIDIERSASLRFLYLYCLGLDSVYFSRLLESIVGTNNELLEFFEQNRLNPWTVSRYADELGISTRKLNFLFYEKFGMSAKQWLLDQRLKKGCELLLSTRLRVADIAMECGFSNHAHFSDSFRRRFQQCPSHMRSLME